MQLYKTLFFAARQGHGATEAQAVSAAPAIHCLQVADQVPRAAPMVTVPHSFNMPAGIHTGPLKPVSNCERLHPLPPRPSRPNSPKRAGGPVGEWCQLKTQSLWAFLSCFHSYSYIVSTGSRFQRRSYPFTSQSFGALHH